MLTISPIRNNSNQNNNNSQPSFGMDYARSYRNFLKNNIDIFTMNVDKDSFELAKEAIKRLGTLRQRNDGLTVNFFKIGDVSDVTIQNKAEQFVTDIDRKLVDWFFDRQTPMKKEELKSSAKTRLENMILREKQGPDGPEIRELNDLLTNGKVPNFDKSIFYNKEHPMKNSWFLTWANYFESPEFLKTMEEGFKAESKSKSKVLAYLKKANEPIYGEKGEKKPLTLGEKISDSVGRFQDFDWLPEIFHYSKAERAKMKELRKLIDEQLG